MSAEDLAFDPDALRRRYLEERERRLRPEGIEQYVWVEGDRAGFADDIYVQEPIERPPLTDEVDVALIGAGFGGLLLGAHLRKLGVESIRLIDKAADVGGTWYFNRYPGVACDIESYVYLPLLEDLGYAPTEKYANGAEIFAHARRIAEAYDLYRDACLQTTVTGLRWDESARRWIIETDRGDAMRARFVCLANGFFQKPKLPGVAGIDTFAGRAFHTSRWDYGYTGGDASGNLTGLARKRVGIIGTGASAVQCIPHLAESAEHLYVFQRTPSSVDVRANRPTDPAWAEALRPGWQRERIDNFQTLTAGGFVEEDLVGDGWTDILTKLLAIITTDDDPDLSPEAIDRAVETADFVKMEEIRARVDALVKDPEIAEALKPWYRQFCKRPCFHDGYLPTYNRPDVTLVDTQGHGVDQITETAVVVGGVEYELDCLILATGFEMGTDYSKRAGFPIVGVDGLSLSEAWADGVRTFHGLYLEGFPNLTMVSIAQSGFTTNFVYLLEIQARHGAWTIATALKRDIERIEASPQAVADWVEAVLERSGRTAEFSANCTPGFYNNEGQVERKTLQAGFYFGGPTEYADILEAWRADGRLDGLECT